MLKESIRIEKFTKVRRIKTTQTTDRGILYTTRSRNDGFVEYESLTEEGLYFLLDHDPNCIDMESQPVKIPKGRGKGKFYYPDAWAKFRDGKQVIFDVKHTLFFESLRNDPDKASKWKKRKKIVKQYCKNNGLDYIIVTEKEIRRERMQNVLFFRKNIRKPADFSKIKSVIENTLSADKKVARIELAVDVGKVLGFNVTQIIPSIDHLIYKDFFLLDFNSEINDNTVLILRKNHDSLITPTYYYILEVKKITQPQLITFTPSPKEPTYDNLNQREFLALPEQTQKEVLKRIELLKIFKQNDVSTVNIKEYAKKHSTSYVSLYRWKKKFDQKGWVGLIPNYHKKGRKKGFSSELEKLVKKVIKERYLTNIQPSITGCYRFLLIECSKEEIDPMSYDTFRLRVQEVSNTEKTLGRRGRKVFRDEYKSLEGEYPFGDHPLDVIEFDHTILDVMLVDRIARRPIGRPVLTLAFDVYSRMIYGYYLSFDPPSYLTVAMCFLTGILPKDDLTKEFGTINKWDIFGLPKTILVDNAMEFRGTALGKFCELYNVVMRANPVKRPDLKPYVERVFRTINEVIRDDLIEGYIIPLHERRKTQYDPEKKAEMTIEEFEQWLIHWIVDEYHQRIHTGIKEKEGIEICPSEKFEQGLAKIGNRTIGLPTIPINLEQLRFDVLPMEKRGLNRNGIRLFGLEYNAPIIAKLRAKQKTGERYIIKYDPRDIREVYLWSEEMSRYFCIPLKKTYYSQLEIDPSDPMNYPISKKELEVLKKSQISRSPNKHYDLVKSMKKRQELIQVARRKTKTGKKARKFDEIRKVHKSKATSTEIRKYEKELVDNPLKSEEIGNKEMENIDENWLKKHAFPSRSRWKEGEY